MRTNKETYQNVADKCSAYSKCDCENRFTNKCGDEEVSCLNCTHFSDGEYCRLDLYDKIVRENNL